MKLKILSRAGNRFAADQGGSVVAETMILFSLLMWAYVAFYVYWDAFRIVNASQKASYTVSDIISREMQPITETYVPGMRDVFSYMVPGNTGERLRVTSIIWSQTANRFEVRWSRTTNGTLMPALTTTGLQAISGGIPTMSDGDSVVLVETEMDYQPMFDVGVAPRVMKQFIVTRPRFVTRVCISTLC